MTVRGAQRGYTLIEALIAIAILSAIAAALAPIIHSSLKAAARISEEGARAEALRTGADALQEIFSSAIRLGAGQERVFTGSRTTIDMTALASLSDAPRRIILTVRDGGLFYSSAPLIETPSANAIDSVPLLSGVGGFRYFGNASKGDALQWQDAWGSDTPPAMVEVAFVDSLGRRLPLSFEISASAPLHCAFDQVSRTCRD